MCSIARFLLDCALLTISLQPLLSQKVARPDVVPFTSADSWKPFKIVQQLYAESAKKAGVKGPVVVYVNIGETGEVERAQAVTGPRELWPSATEAVKQWKWKPHLLNEKPARVRTRVVVNCILEDGSPDKKAATNH